MGLCRAGCGRATATSSTQKLQTHRITRADVARYSLFEVVWLASGAVGLWFGNVFNGRICQDFITAAMFLNLLFCKHLAWTEGVVTVDKRHEVTISFEDAALLGAANKSLVDLFEHTARDASQYQVVSLS